MVHMYCMVNMPHATCTLHLPAPIESCQWRISDLAEAGMLTHQQFAPVAGYERTRYVMQTAMLPASLCPYIHEITFVEFKRPPFSSLIREWLEM